MFRMEEGDLFARQWTEFSLAYRDRAGITVAEGFVVAVVDALEFIRKNPFACTLYDPGEGYDDLARHQFRKWSLQRFPHAIIFRIVDNATIFIDVIYAHRMNMAARLAVDIADEREH